MCGFLPRLRVCAQECRKAPHCADVRATPKNAGTIFQPNAEKPRRSGKNPPSKGGPASHLASRRRPGSLPNASNRAEAHTHFYKWEYEKGMQMRMECENSNSPLDTIVFKCSIFSDKVKADLFQHMLAPGVFHNGVCVHSGHSQLVKGDFYRQMFCLRSISFPF